MAGAAVRQHRRNCGSSTINRKAEIAGLVFDGNIHSAAGGFGMKLG